MKNKLFCLDCRLLNCKKQDDIPLYRFGKVHRVFAHIYLEKHINIW